MTQKELAKELGVSLTSVCKWLKKGMPGDSVQAAQVWRASRTLRTPGCRSKQIAPRVEPEKIKDAPSLDKIDTSMDAVIERAKLSEYMAGAALKDANEKGQMEIYKLLTDNHARAVKARIDAETASIELKKASGELITLDEAVQRWGAMANSIRMLLDALPKSVGARCNPSDPELAIEALNDWVQNQALKVLHE